MALDVITGPAFSGKARFVQTELERREAGGELGLLLIDFTAIFAALIPGVQSQLRDETVSDTGASRMAGFIYEAALGAAVVRQLKGYVTTNSPRRAAAIADRVGASVIFELRADVDDLADRTDDHMRALGRRVKRADRGRMAGPCRGAITTYLNEAPALRDRAVRPVHQDGRGYRVGRSAQGSGYDREAFNRGITPAGRKARAELIVEGMTDPAPADIFRRVLAERIGR